MTMTLIESKTLLSAAASIEFTSIPQTFTDLVLIHSARSAVSNTVVTAVVQFNGDTGANYSVIRVEGTGSGVNTSALNSNALYGLAGPIPAANATSNTFGNGVVYIPNYTSSTAKSFSSDGVSENNATLAAQVINAVIWTGTAAITSILFRTFEVGNLVAGSTVSLYGITKGSDGIVTTS
jgi:hypothetical protein